MMYLEPDFFNESNEKIINKTHEIYCKQCGRKTRVLKEFSTGECRRCFFKDTYNKYFWAQQKSKKETT